MDNKTIEVALALGSNMGDRLTVLRTAVEALAPYVSIIKKSSVYETAAAYVTDQPAFLNAAVIGETSIEPLSLLWNVKQIENDLGRLPTFRYGPRAIDIDIIFYGQNITNTPELKIPHPRMTEREFVLRPLADIAPDWKYPENGLTVAEMLARVPTANPACLGPL